jgi:CubicO group peptidase (beta-lactamase class C family)
MKKVFYLSVLALFIFTEVHAQKEATIDLKELDTYYAAMIKDWDIPSASIGIVKNGELIFTGNYGVLEEGKKEKPNEQSLYAIASNSKAFTSAMTGMLVQEGKLSWDDKVKKHLPYFAMYDAWVSEHITIKDILSHRSGLGTFSGDNIWYKSNATSKEIIEHIKFVPQAFEFRAGYGYSNLMYITAGEIIKTITGKTWGENVKERILDPLDMKRTISSITDLGKKGNFASPHARKENKNVVIPWVSWDNVAATGGLISSVEDISKWMIFNLNNGINGNDTLLSKKTRNIVWKPHNNFLVNHTDKNFDQHFSSYGLGWSLSDYHGRMKVGHTGGYDGMITAITLIPDEQLGIVVLTNGVKSPIGAATNYALDMFLGLKTKDWSTNFLNRTNKRNEGDTRISDRKTKRALNTTPTVSIEKFVGAYYSDMYGKISITDKDDKLHLLFEHSPLLSATLTHWHHDVWEIHWNHPQAWFSFGTIKINTDNNLKVVSFDFDVPNDDFFFEELKPHKLQTIGNKK